MAFNLNQNLLRCSNHLHWDGRNM